MTFAAALLVLLVIFVNGFTDAPGAISGIVLTHRLTLGRAATLAAAGNLAGCLSAVLFFPRLGETVAALAPEGPAAVGAVMFCVAFWGLAAFVFGIPTSESHALVAALCGVRMACVGWRGLDGGALARVGWGMVLSTLPAALLGALCVRLAAVLWGRTDRRRTRRAVGGLQLSGAALSAFFHGAQDGQKFLGVLLCLYPGLGSRGKLSTALVCAAVLSLGTALGGGRIIRRMGKCLGRHDGVRLCCGDFAAAAILFFCSLCGLPVSTTHVKTCAAFGAGRVMGGRGELRNMAEMSLAWILTVPACLFLGLLSGWLLCKGGWIA